MNESETRKVNEMEENDLEDTLQVVVCGTSEEGNLLDFAREHRELCGADETEEVTSSAKRSLALNTHINKKVKKGISPATSSLLSSHTFTMKSNSQNSLDIPSEFLNNRESAVEYMTQNKKLILEWEFSNFCSSSSGSSSCSIAHSWLTAPYKNKSIWFNYGLDEHSFKEWLQRQLDERLSRLEKHKISNNEESDFYDCGAIGEGIYSDNCLKSRGVKGNAASALNFNKKNNSAVLSYCRGQNYSNCKNSSFACKASAHLEKEELSLQQKGGISSQKLYSHVASDNYGVNIQKSTYPVAANAAKSRRNSEELESDKGEKAGSHKNLSSEHFKAATDENLLNGAAVGSSNAQEKNAEDSATVPRHCSNDDQSKQNEDSNTKIDDFSAPQLNQAVIMKLKGLGTFLKNI